MAEMRRSATSFRRFGSSGLVWNDKFRSGFNEENQNQEANPRRYQEENASVEIARELRQSQSVGPINTLERSQSEGACPYRTVMVAPPSKDPPSPKATCWFCGIFGKPDVATYHPNPKSKKHR